MGIGKLRAALIGGFVAFAVVPAAQAQEFTSMFVFGDSLSDSGNLFALTGGTVPTSPPYYQGRFSNGPVWVENLAPALGFDFNPAMDFAVGGAESGTGGLVGVATQIGAFAAAGGTIDPNALVVVWAGGNDYLNNAATTPPEVLIPSVVTNLATAVGTLAALGGRTFLVPNLPDLGTSPGGNASGFAEALGALTEAHNAGLVNAMMGLEGALGARIVVMDVYGMFNDLLADPAAYGISFTAIPCLVPGGATGICDSPEATAATLFWDPIHPSATGHALLGQFANATLFQDFNGARISAVTSFIAPQMLDMVRQGINTRLNGLRAANAFDDPDRGTVPYFSVKVGRGSRNGGAGVAGFNYDLTLFTFGLDRSFGESLIAGVSLTHASGETRADGGLATADFNSTVVAAYASYSEGGWYADLALAGSWEDYDIDRVTLFDPRPLASADSDGNSYYVALDTGLNFNAGNFTFGPAVGMRYLNSDMDSYMETGAAMLNLAVAKQDSSGWIGSVGFQASGVVNDRGLGFMPHLRVAYEKEIEEMKHAAAITTSVGQTRTVSGGTGDDDWVLIGAGFVIQATARVSLSLDYEGAFRGSGDNDHAVVGRLAVAF